MSTLNYRVIFFWANKGGGGKTTIAASLKDVVDADIIDHDPQGTLRVTAALTGRNVPVSKENITKKVVIHDTPPYNASELRDQAAKSDIIIIPCRVSAADLVAVRPIVDALRKLKITDKAYIVFNAVRKPHTNQYKKLKRLFMANYKDIKKAKTELSNLVAFEEIFEKPLHGQARREIEELAKELHIIM